MNALIDAAFTRSRSVIVLFLLVLGLGATAYQTIPKEAEPDVPIPLVYVSMSHEGIAPNDAERLLIRPMERELQSIEGLDTMRATAAQGYAALTLEFDAGFDADQALTDVREQVDIARSELPADTDEPRVQAVNVALFPVLTVALSGSVPERTLVTTAQRLQDAIEALPGVLEVDIGGDREEVMEVIIGPTALESYQLSFDEVLSRFQRNNRLVAAGTLHTEAGRFALQVPGVIEERADIFELPIKVEGDRVVTLGEIATIRRAYADPEGFARIDGEPAVALEIKKRVGANIIETIAGVRGIIAAEQAQWQDRIHVTYLQDKSEQVRTLLGDLQNNVLTAIVLVMIVIIAALGPRPALLVGLAIPGSFLAAILVLQALGLTLNIVVLFSLILVVGLLVDAAIVTVELADRRRHAGLPPREAFASAAQRMAWPIIASTATTLAVFVPLLLWPGIVGAFMRYLPITVIVTLIASLAMALIFVPVLGARLFGRRGPTKPSAAPPAPEEARPVNPRDPYLRLLGRLLDRPGSTLMVAVALLVGTYAAYGAFGRGIEFFPAVEPDFAQVQVRARGDRSVWEKDAIVRAVEARLLAIDGVEHVYTRTRAAAGTGAEDWAADVIGVIQLDFADWQVRPPAQHLIATLRARTADIPGIIVQVQAQEQGPTAGKPIQLEISSRDPTQLGPAVEAIQARMTVLGGFVDIEDSRPFPGVEWALEMDRVQAARFGADVALLGQTVQLVTQGITVGEYRPDDADADVDIRVRYPVGERSLDRLQRLRIPTEAGPVPIANFVRFVPQPKTGTLTRVDAQRVITLEADVAPGRLVSAQTERLKAALAEADLPATAAVRFKGEDEDIREATTFLRNAFLAAIVLMLGVLLTQFNRFDQALIILTAIGFSTAGVLLGLLITGRPFGIVMVGIGVIALAGIVVNNNIVLIDTYNAHRAWGLPRKEAILRSARQRRRPVLLTSLTTILGLLPMVFQLNVDLIGATVEVGAPSTQWWTELSSAIAGGLAFATLLTLILTPCLLMLTRDNQRTDAAETAAHGR